MPLSNNVPISDAARRERMAQRVRAARQAMAEPAGIPRQPPSATIALSHAQEQYWFLDTLTPGDPAYSCPHPLRLTGALDRAALEQALNALVERSEVLRTRYEQRDGELVGIVMPHASFALPVADLRALPEPERQAEAQRLVEADAGRPFDIASGPVFRATLVQLGEAEHLLLLNIHHIAFDGWSASVLRAELAALYAAASAGTTAPAPPPTLQYADYAAWRRRKLDGAGLDRQMAYWRKQLSGQIPPTPLPLDRPRTGSRNSAGKTQPRRFSPALTNALRTLSRQEDITLFMTLLAGFDALLYRWSGQPDIILGVPVAGRTRVELENMIGLFMNSVALRVNLGGRPSVRELLQRVRRVSLEAHDHQDLSVSQLVEALQPVRVPGQTPLFQVLFQLRNMPAPPPAMGGVSVVELELESDVTQLDLTVDLMDEPEGLLCVVHYKTVLFDDETITALLDDFECVLAAFAADPAAEVDALPVPARDRRRSAQPSVPAYSAGPVRPLPPVATAAALFEAHARTQPEHPAVVAEGGETLSYRELDRRANQLAHYLAGVGVGPEVVVAVCLERTPLLLAALLAIHKAGGAYLPLDPDFPAERLAFMLSDSNAHVLLTDSHLRGALPAGTAKVICQDEIGGALDQQPAGPPAAALDRPSLAYIIYTSGSTGSPKGVLVEHGSLLNMALAEGEALNISPRDRVLQFASLNWDTSLEEIFSALAMGATLVLRTPDMLGSIPNFFRRCRELGITVTIPPTAFFHEIALAADPAMLQSVPALRLIAFGGERARPEHLARWRALGGDHIHLINSYGLTEAAAVSAVADVDAPAEAAGGEVPIGRPMANMQAYVLDEQRRPVADGASGELYLGGMGLARGYLNQPALTEERFVAHPFSAEPGARLYRTGDLARWLPDGQLVIHGRLDRQLKLRGFRIEPAEVERAVMAHSAVSEALVAVREVASDNPVLAAYIVLRPGAAVESAELDAFLTQRLPDFMRPAALMFLPTMPLGPTGKIDLSALPMPSPEQVALGTGYAAPRTVVEERLVEIWQQLLGVERIGIQDDFFALGGHSLLAIRLFSQIEAAFGQKLPLATLFELPTIAYLAQMLGESQPAPRWNTLVAIQPKGARPPFFCVHGFGGGVVGYAELARLLGEDQPFYGLQARGQDGASPPDETIESMAAHYVEVIRAQQPYGPYLLGGYCFGGVVAFEVARQFEALGEPVALVAIFEGYPPVRTQAAARRWWTPRMLFHRLRNLPYWLLDFAQLGRLAMWSQVRQAGRKRLGNLAWRLRLGMPLDMVDLGPNAAEVPDHIRRIMELHIRASRQYLPQPYGGRITLFNVRSQSLSRTPGPDRGWATLARQGVNLRRIAGAHHSILFVPHVQSLARELAEAMRESKNAEHAAQA